MQNQHVELTGVHLGCIVAYIKNYDPEVCEIIRRAVDKYLVVDGKFTELMEVYSKFMRITAKFTDTVPVIHKRTTADKSACFERRLETYDTIATCNIEIVVKIKEILTSMNYPHDVYTAGSHNEYGRGTLTDAKMLMQAIKRLENPTDRTDCNANFESLATQVWGWKYVKLTNDMRLKLIADFNEKQSNLSANSVGTFGCSNITVRMLWHFDIIGIPYDIRMFRVPESDDSWNKNIAALQMSNIWDPRKIPHFEAQNYNMHI
jgi:hypothetical protein